MIHQEVVEPFYNQEQAASIKLIGVGGGGCNAVEHMIAADIHGVDFTLVNTDAQALAKYNPDNVIQLGDSLTRGLGAGTDPEIGRLAAEEDADLIAATIEGTDMLFLTAGMGGGTGTGAVSVIARIARELGVLTVAVVTKPFGFEGGKRRQVAEAGLKELRKHVDSLIVVPNENLLTHLGPNISLIEAFAASNDVLTNAVQSIAELITDPGLINVDFADVKSVMTETGEAMMSTGRGIGEFRARDAAIAATESPLLEEIDLNEARGILANITASDSLSMGEFQIVGDILDQITASDANVVIGTVFDPDMNDEIRVTVVATGLQANQRQPAPPPRKSKPASSGFLGFGSNRSSGGKRKANRKDSRLRYREQPEVAELRHEHAPYREPAYADDYDEPVYSEPHYEEPVFDDAVYEAPVKQQPAQEQIAEPEIRFCQACGNQPDNHTENCPLRNDEPKQTRSFLLDDRHALGEVFSSKEDEAARRASQAQDRPAPAKASAKRPPAAQARPERSEKKKSLNKHVAGLVAGTVVLLSVFYILTSNKMELQDNAVAQSSAPTSIADRKLRDAQRRLSGLEN